MDSCSVLHPRLTLIETSAACSSVSKRRQHLRPFACLSSVCLLATLLCYFALYTVATQGCRSSRAVTEFQELDKENWALEIEKLCLIRVETDRTFEKGPVTDYGSTMVRWMRNRGPKGILNPRLEQERPSASYIVDVSL